MDPLSVNIEIAWDASNTKCIYVATVRMESSAMDMQALQGKGLQWKIFMRHELMVLKGR